MQKALKEFRSNLIEWEFYFAYSSKDNRLSLNLQGTELVTILGLNDIKVGSKVIANIQYTNGDTNDVELTVKIDTDVELQNYQNGGILQR